MTVSNELIGTPHTERQHYLPQFFIEGFTDKKDLVCIRRENGRLDKPKKGSPARICYRKRDNEAMLSDGTALFPNGLEKDFAAAESKMAPPFKALLCEFRSLSPKLNRARYLRDSVNLLSLMLSWFVCRAADSDDIAPLESVKSCLMEDDVSSLQLFQEFIDDSQTEIDVLPDQKDLSPAVEKSLQKYLCCMPFNGDSLVCQNAKAIARCSVKVIRAGDGSDIVGADLPLIEPGFIYWPIASDLAVIFADDLRRQFTVSTFDAESITELNKALALRGDWSFLFGSDGSAVSSLHGLIENGQADKG